MLNMCFVNSMEKVLSDREWSPEIKNYCSDVALKGEIFSFQIALSRREECGDAVPWNLHSVLPEGFEDAVTVRVVQDMPVRLTTWVERDDNILARRAALLPDLLKPWNPEDGFAVAPLQYRTLWVTVSVPREITAGKYEFTFSVSQHGAEPVCSGTFSLNVLNGVLPPQEIKRTEWFYAECLSLKYDTVMWSEKHWQVLEKYFRNQTDHGCTRILTPLFTPPLDTAVGSERLTTQLVTVSRNSGNGYSFDFSLLERWIQLALQCGYSEIEFAHLFSQWGAEFAPKIVVDGVNVFGWKVRSDSREYKEFLEAFIPELLNFLERHDWSDIVVFHLSDEPSLKHLDNYKYASGLLKELLGEKYTVTDALSNLDFYKQGLCAVPVAGIEELPAFHQDGVKPLWVYYCCGPEHVATNRFIHFPAARTRSLGIQLFMYDCDGFLHWGYNFWYSRLAKEVINPYETTDANGLFPAGDPFLVYPGKDGPEDSIRHEILREAFQDHRACKLLEQLAGRKTAEDVINNAAGTQVSVSVYPGTAPELYRVRKAIYEKLEKYLTF